MKSEKIKIKNTFSNKMKGVEKLFFPADQQNSFSRSSNSYTNLFWASQVLASLLLTGATYHIAVASDLYQTTGCLQQVYTSRNHTFNNLRFICNAL